MESVFLLNKLKKFMSVKNKGLEERTVKIRNMSFSNLRDNLIGLGTILEEDFELQSYVLSISAGIANQNKAVIVAQLRNDKLQLMGYAKEGLINQHTAKKAIEKIVSRIEKYLDK